MMNKKTKRNLKKVIAGGLLALALTIYIPTTTNADVVTPTESTVVQPNKGVDPPGV